MNEKRRKKKSENFVDGEREKKTKKKEKRLLRYNLTKVYIYWYKVQTGMFFILYIILLKSFFFFNYMYIVRNNGICETPFYLYHFPLTEKKKKTLHRPNSPSPPCTGPSLSLNQSSTFILTHPS